jgi:prepilin-type N-terminal cleavage/methylation domain-containing protein
MSKDQHTLAKPQAGFTLVELAIVMIIIGLLIAGVLKGQELITNAKTTSTVAQIKSIDAAVSSFKDQYGAIPGDLTTPTTRIPNCGTACQAATGANGDGNLDSANSFGAAPGVEAKAFFPELADANLITGLIDNTAAGSWGNTNPLAKIDTAGFMVGTVTTVSTTNLPGSGAVLGTPSGLYLALVGSATAPTGAPTAALGAGIQPKQANSIDLKLDDGSPNSGSTIAIGTTTGAAGACTNGTAAASVYYSVNASNTCGLYIRIQG